MVNESTIRSFLTLVRAGTVTEAAHRLFLTQQAVSKQLSKLEEDLGCTLLLRERGKLVLTPAGEIYFKAFSEMDEIFSTARGAAARLNSDLENTLALGQPELLDIHPFSRPYLRTLQARHPEIKIHFRSATLWNIMQWLEDQSVDAIYTWENEVAHRSGLDYLPLAQVREMLVVSSDHPKAVPGASYLDFIHEPVFYTAVPEGGEQPLQQRLLSIGFSTEHVVMTDNLLSSCAAVEQLQGINFLMENCQILQSDRYATYPTPNLVTLVLAYRKGNKKKSLVRLLDAVQQWKLQA